MMRLVAVVVQHRGAAAAEGAVDHCLDRAHLQAIVELRAPGAGRNHRASGLAVVEHRIDANRQFACGPQFLVETVLARIDAGIMHAGHAERRKLVHRCAERALDLIVGRLRNMTLDQRSRRIHEYAGRLTGVRRAQSDRRPDLWSPQ